MLWLKVHNLHIDLQILDNETSVEYKQLMTECWGVKYQLVPPHMHCRNAAERVICIFKVNFLAILAGAVLEPPKYLWDILLPQAEIILIFLCNTTINPIISAWEYYAGPFNYEATPLGILRGCAIARSKPFMHLLGIL